MKEDAKKKPQINVAKGSGQLTGQNRMFYDTDKHLFRNRENGDREIKALDDLGLACMALMDSGLMGEDVSLDGCIAMLGQQVHKCLFMYSEGSNHDIIDDKIDALHRLIDRVKSIGKTSKLIFREMFFIYISSAAFEMWEETDKDTFTATLSEVLDFVDEAQPTIGKDGRTITMIDILNCWGVTNRI